MLIVALRLLLVVSLSAHSAEAVFKVAIPADDQEVGAFADFERVSDMLAHNALQLLPMKLPARRAYLMLFHGTVDCVLDFPENATRAKNGGGYLHSPPLGSYPFYFFTLADEDNPPSSAEDARHLVVGIPRRHEFYLAPFVQNMNKVETARSEGQLLRMLKLRRIDVILAAFPYMEPYKKRLRFDRASPLATARNHLICHDTETNLRLLNFLQPKGIE